MSRPAFEHSPLIQAAADLAVEVYAITDTSTFDGRDSLRSQLGSAALSISDILAEGLERPTKHEFRAFLFVARSSASEVRSLLRALEEDPEFAGGQAELLSLRSKAEAISKALGTWGRSLRNAPVRMEAPDAKARKVTLAARRTREFLYELEQMRSNGGKTQAQKFITQVEAPEPETSSPGKGAGSTGLSA
jgi:four helix bundle protein